MARRAPWRHSLHPIQERATLSKLEYWRREDIEYLFAIKREAARNIMRATGNIENLGAVHVVSKYALVDLIEKLIAADDPDRVLANLLDKAPSRRIEKPLQVPIPEQFKTIGLSELPSNIIIKPGRLEIEGNAFVILQSLALLARALEGEIDLAQFCKRCNQTPETDKKLYNLLGGLRKRFNSDGSPVESSATTDSASLDEGEDSGTFLIGSPW
jgi:hypothetical protein